jgi:GTP-binding protein HflX
MDQQAGGMARARGPGETASELLARKLDSRLLELERSLERLTTSAATQRRQRGGCKRIVLIGYTNAGKTSLMNALTSAELSARDMPFETLDTTSRCLTRHGGDVLLSDTVGFIRRLPERLLASFESTLAEILDASLLAVVVDASDPERDLHLATTHALLERMGASHIPRLYVWNKVDRLEGLFEPVDAPSLAPFLAVSSRDPEAVARLRGALLEGVRREEEAVSIFVPYGRVELLSLVYRTCRVKGTVATDEGLELSVEAPPAVLERIRAGGAR